MAQSWTAAPDGQETGYSHQRESTLSTTCSSTSGSSRVLPFATTRALPAACAMAAIAEAAAEDGDAVPSKVCFDNPRFALAQPRRVATFNAGEAAARSGVAIRISSILGERGGGRLGVARGRPIIGLGVTLNPSDALVRLQPRRSATQPTADPACVVRGLAEAGWAPGSAIRAKRAAGLAGAIPRSPPAANSPLASRSSIVLSDAFASGGQLLRSSASLPGLAQSPLNADPLLVPLRAVPPPPSAHPPSVANLDASIAMLDCPVPRASHDADEARAPVAAPLGPPLLPPPGPAARRPPPREICCMLCFERVKIGPRSRGRTRCPGCGTGLAGAVRRPRVAQPVL
ncbi:hypothetical protein H4R21_002485 [Coemansia helicoidea]|uniref:Uncharacterized protein n=1 Tax=Coemansia helicoidea TaxID=1286919 RepID=A0ACC1L685_9FUNG|nr:hypothetical protein H4R21_002485 [Coemansia helicoidea]